MPSAAPSLPGTSSRPQRAGLPAGRQAPSGTPALPGPAPAPAGPRCRCGPLCRCPQHPPLGRAAGFLPGRVSGCVCRASAPAPGPESARTNASLCSVFTAAQEREREARLPSALPSAVPVTPIGQASLRGLLKGSQGKPHPQPRCCGRPCAVALFCGFWVDKAGRLWLLTCSGPLRDVGANIRIRLCQTLGSSPRPPRGSRPTASSPRACGGQSPALCWPSRAGSTHPHQD